MQSLPISRLVNVDIVLSPKSAQAQDLSTLLVLGTSDVINVVERIRDYLTLDEVAADFGTTAPEYLSSLLWFAQSPQPNLIKIGRWAKTATSAKLIGGALSAAQQAISAWTAITTPAFEFVLNGIPVAIAPASFAGVTNLNAVAAIIQTALANVVPFSTCVWNANYQRFEFESGLNGPTSTMTFLNAPTAVGNILFGVNPSNNDTITLNGTAVTFVNGAPGLNQVQIGSSIADTLARLQVVLAASVDSNITKFVTAIFGNYLTLVSVVAGPVGNTLTIAASAAAASGATLLGGSGTDISQLLGMFSGLNGAYVANGIAAETAVAAATLFDAQYGQTWYGLVIPAAVNADHVAVGSYIEGANNKHVYGITSSDGGILSAVATSDIASQLSALKLTRSIVQYSSSSLYAVCSLLGRALTVDYNGNSTVIALMYKQEPVIVAENLTASQVDVLEAKHANVFVQYNNDTAIIEPGMVSSGDFIDTRTGTDWLAVTVMTNLFNLLYTSTTKVPQTDAGMHLLVNVIAAVCSQGIANGLIAAGVWNSNGFGALSDGDYMPSGFYIYAPPVALQLQSDREARKSVPIQVAVKLAGAIQTIDVTINVNR